ncbi:MAG: polyamine aminopropyltransferase [SAR202 cluster bacterium]|nr:polyamine aminopropyltransferase [SAR202 cluster bacterium]
MKRPPAPKAGERWHFEIVSPGLVAGYLVKRKLYDGKTPYQHVVVHDTAALGRILVLDDKSQSSEADEFIFHEALVQPSMIAHPNPKRVFIAGGGEGATAREALSHRSVERVVMVDIDEKVVELCHKHLQVFHRGAFDDPRLELRHEDALKYLEQTKERFDVVVVDVPDPLEAGPAWQLFTQEFYRLIKRRLNPNGMMVAQSGPTGPVYAKNCFTAIAKTLASVFPVFGQCESFIPAFQTTWGFVFGSLGPDPRRLTPAQVDKRIAARVTYPLRYYDGVTHRGMFSLPKYLRDAIAAEKRLITKKTPIFIA